jgi:hypothetical protein
VPRRPLHADVPSLHDPDVGLEVVRLPVATLRLADHVCQGSSAVEVGDGARLDVETPAAAVWMNLRREKLRSQPCV